MSGNIFMAVISAAGPVVGEGLKEGFQGTIELDSFGWDMSLQKDPKAKLGGGANALKSLGALVGVGGVDRIRVGSLSITKKFDIASPILHTYLDNHVLILSVVITVLHIKPGGQAVHQPGFVLTAENGYFQKSSLSLSGGSGNSALKETMTFNAKGITINYVKSLGVKVAGGGMNAPTNPFWVIKGT